MSLEEQAAWEDATPNPEYLVKAISEQGYSFEAALADLIDNSISANADKVEILTDKESEPYTLFLADNGHGMDEDTLRACMQFPSCSHEQSRAAGDLGRFGLGMKTASFSQTRCFTVISRNKVSGRYAARTWDVDLLKEGKWKVIVNSEAEIEELLVRYHAASQGYLRSFDDFEPNTLVIWQGLYKFEEYLAAKNREEALNREVTEVVSEHLALVFHLFMEDKKQPLQIRVNNARLKPFNPFPTSQKNFRKLDRKKRLFGDDEIKVEGYILPASSMDDVKKGSSIWTTRYRSLMDMEGIYVYRARRLILFGGWNGLIRKAQRLQLARLRVVIGNGADHLLHLNVAKSQVIIPHELKKAFEGYITELKAEAEREFFNRGLKKFSSGKKETGEELFNRVHSNKGVMLEVNQDFPLIKSLQKNMDKTAQGQLAFLLRLFSATVNGIRQVNPESNFGSQEAGSAMDAIALEAGIKAFIDDGFDPAFIKKNLLPKLGYSMSTLPTEVLELLEK